MNGKGLPLLLGAPPSGLIRVGRAGGNRRMLGQAGLPSTQHCLPGTLTQVFDGKKTSRRSRTIGVAERR